MKNKVIYLSVIIILGIFLISCADLKITSSNVTEDADAVDLNSSQKTSWRDDFIINGDIDKSGFLTPVAIEDYIRLKVSIPGEEVDLVESEVYLFEDENKKGYVIDKLSDVKSKTDISIILDATGSMGGAITGVKNSIVSFSDSLETSGLDVQVSVIPYNDYGPAQNTAGDYTYDPSWKNLDTPSNIKDYVENNIFAYGGAGTPENPYEALLFAWNNISWRGGAERLFILITDATSHYTDDGLADGGRTDSEWLEKSDVLMKIKNRGVIHSVVVPGYSYSISDPESDYEDPDDVRSLSTETSGLILYTDGGGNVDLESIGIIEALTNTYIVTFKSTSAQETHKLELYVEKDSLQGKLILNDIEY
ncbi:MAG: vWA domain-containing protein [Thermotogota bacterium]